MKKNVGGLERTFRLAVGPLVLLAAIASLRGSDSRASALGLLALAVGGSLTATGLTQQCPANSALGRDTYGTAARLSDEAQEVRERATR